MRLLGCAESEHLRWTKWQWDRFFFEFFSSSSYGSTAQFGPWPPPLGFRNINLFNRAGLLVQRPTPNLENHASIFMTPVTGWPSCTLRHWVPILVAFYDMNGLQWDYYLIPATTRKVLRFPPVNIIPPWFSIFIYHLGGEQ
jgi:hypothetical protein